MNRMKLLRERKGITQKEFAEIFNVAPSTVSGWEAENSEMNYDTIVKVAGFYGTSVDYLLGKDFFTDKLTKDERALIASFRGLPLKGQKFIMEITDRLKSMM